MTKNMKATLLKEGLALLSEVWRRWLSPFEGAALGKMYTEADEKREAEEWARKEMYKRRVAAMEREGWV